MVEAMSLTSTSLQTLVGLAGALVGMIAASIALRERSVSRRANRLERELELGLNDLERRKQEPAAVGQAIENQTVAVENLRLYVERRRFVYRLILGYFALLGLAVVAVGVVFRLSDLSFQGGFLGWFSVGLAGAALLSVFVFYLGAARRLKAESLTVSIGPLEINLEEREPLLPEQKYETAAKKWLESGGFEASQASLDSGFDLIGVRPADRLAVEIKAVPRLTIADVDAVIGAVARLRSDEESGQVTRAALFLPERAVQHGSPAAIKAAVKQNVEIYQVDEGGQVHPLGSSAHDFRA